jgi:hypothetical protein
MNFLLRQSRVRENCFLFLFMQKDCALPFIKVKNRFSQSMVPAWQLMRKFIGIRTPLPGGALGRGGFGAMYGFMEF